MGALRTGFPCVLSDPMGIDLSQYRPRTYGDRPTIHAGLRLASSYLIANGREPAATVISLTFRGRAPYMFPVHLPDMTARGTHRNRTDAPPASLHAACHTVSLISAAGYCGTVHAPNPFMVLGTRFYGTHIEVLNN